MQMQSSPKGGCEAEERSKTLVRELEPITLSVSSKATKKNKNAQSSNCLPRLQKEERVRQQLRLLKPDIQNGDASGLETMAVGSSTTGDYKNKY